MPRLAIELIRPAIALIAASLAVTAPATAQDYPTRPITLVVPYAAGGGNDVMARIAADKMSKTLGQQIVMLEAALQEPAGAAGVTLTVENGAILITPPL